MSRNLGRTDCDRCGLSDFTLGEVYSLPDDHWCCPSMEVRDVTCKVCGAAYTGWAGPVGGLGPFGGPTYGAAEWEKAEVERLGFYDLSYRSTFNDEPGEEDVPGRVEVLRVVKVNGRVVREQDWEE